MRLFVYTVAAAITAASSPQVFAKDMVASAELPLICAATHTYKGQEISVRRLFKKEGLSEIDNGLPDSKALRAGDDEIAAKIRQQLYDYVTGLSKNPAKDCSPDNSYDGHEIHVFDCSQYWQDGPNHYSIGYNKAEWRYEEGSDWRMRLEWFLNSNHDWTVSGFPDRDHKTTFPTLFAVRPAHWAASNYTVQVSKKKRDWHLTELGQVSVGDQKVRDWTDNNTFRILWNQWPMLMQGKGDVDFTVYDTQKGVLLQRTFPRTFLADIETQMKTGYQQMIKQAENNITSCKRLDSWEGGEDEMIVVT
jgi:hypothetical protein